MPLDNTAFVRLQTPRPSAIAGKTVDGKELARKTIPHTIPLLMTIDETFDIGIDTRTPVDDSYELPFRFTGTIDKLTIKLGPSQLSEPEQQAAAEAIRKAKD